MIVDRYHGDFVFSLMHSQLYIGVICNQVIFNLFLFFSLGLFRTGIDYESRWQTSNNGVARLKEEESFTPKIITRQ